MTSRQDALRRLSLHDQGFLNGVLSAGSGRSDSAQLDARACSLGRMAALFALDAPDASYGWATSVALASGVTSDELVELLISLAPVIGSARVVSAAPKLGMALGYDVEADIEGLDAGLRVG
jgi:4-carboxymuconolactone decarboxylase